MAAAISGSASARVALKKESGAEAGLALEELIGEISPPPQPFSTAGGSGLAVERSAWAIPYRPEMAK
jgi:hypothetical protein